MMNIARKLSKSAICRYAAPTAASCANLRVQTNRKLSNKNKAVQLKVKEKTAQTSGSTRRWRTVIGLEVHVQLSTASKMFSSSSTRYGDVANRTVTFWDFALPGTLPVLSRSSVESALRLSKVLNCTINDPSFFDRKHYFYPDLPSGYQITQQRVPLAERGFLEYLSFGDRGSMQQAQVKRARIERIQLEHDSGRSIHDKGTNQLDKISKGRFLVDLNRSGVGLVELVTAPDFENANDACAFIDDLRRLVVALNVSTGRLDEGAMRVDANVSVHASDEPVVPYRVEIKNLNSLYAVRHAIAYEVKRHIRIFEANPNLRTIDLETRAFDSGSLRTVAMRDKQDALDYRFMPEPNLPALRLKSSGANGTWNLIEAVGEADRAVLPFFIRDRLMKEDGLSALAATVLLDERGLLEYYQETLGAISSKFREVQDSSGKSLVPVSSLGNVDSSWSAPRDLKADAGVWITSLFLALLRQRGVASASESRLRPVRFAEFLAFASQRYSKLRLLHSKKLLEHLFESDSSGEVSVADSITKLGIPLQVSDESVISDCVKRTLEAHPESIASFRKRASKGKFQRNVVLDFIKKSAQKEGNEALNDVILDRLVLAELANRGCQVRFDDEDAAAEPVSRTDSITTEKIK